MASVGERFALPWEGRALRYQILKAADLNVCARVQVESASLGKRALGTRRARAYFPTCLQFKYLADENLRRAIVQGARRGGALPPQFRREKQPDEEV